MNDYLNRKYLVATPHILQKNHKLDIISECNPVLIFQIFYTMAIFQKYEPKFIHGNLVVKNIFVYKSSNIGYNCYKYDNRNFYVPNIGVSVAIGGFDHSTIPGFIDNDPVLNIFKINDLKSISTSLKTTFGYNIDFKNTTFGNILLDSTNFTKKKSRTSVNTYNSSDIVKFVQPSICNRIRYAWIAVPLKKNDKRFDLIEFQKFKNTKLIILCPIILNNIAQNFVYNYEDGYLHNKSTITKMNEYNNFWNKVDFPEDSNYLGLFDWAFYIISVAEHDDINDFNTLYERFKQIIPLKTTLDLNNFILIIKSCIVQWNWNK